MKTQHSQSYTPSRKPYPRRVSSSRVEEGRDLGVDAIGAWTGLKPQGYSLKLADVFSFIDLLAFLLAPIGGYFLLKRLGLWCALLIAGLSAGLAPSTAHAKRPHASRARTLTAFEQYKRDAAADQAAQDARFAQIDTLVHAANQILIAQVVSPSSEPNKSHQPLVPLYGVSANSGESAAPIQASTTVHITPVFVQNVSVSGSTPTPFIQHQAQPLIPHVGPVYVVPVVAPAYTFWP